MTCGWQKIGRWILSQHLNHTPPGSVSTPKWLRWVKGWFIPDTELCHGVITMDRKYYSFPRQTKTQFLIRNNFIEVNLYAMLSEMELFLVHRLTLLSILLCVSKHRQQMPWCSKPSCSENLTSKAKIIPYSAVHISRSTENEVQSNSVRSEIITVTGLVMDIRK